MRTAAELYPGATDYFRGGYTPIIEALGAVLVREDVGYYQGDTFVLLRGDDGRPGVAVIGWGSCSGCDALEACRSLADVDDLIADIVRGVRWFDDDAAARRWLSEPSADFHWSESEGFRLKALAALP